MLPCFGKVQIGTRDHLQFSANNALTVNNHLRLTATTIKIHATLLWKSTNRHQRSPSVQCQQRTHCEQSPETYCYHNQNSCYLALEKYKSAPEINFSSVPTMHSLSTITLLLPQSLFMLPSSALASFLSQYGPAAPLMLPSVPTLAQVPSLYSPLQAAPLAAARFFNAVWAAALFSFLPNQVTMQVFCKAFPYEKDKCHGNLPLNNLFIVLRLMVALSSLSTSSGVSPDKKKMPGIATGTVRNKVSQVLVAISSGDARGPSSPFLTMFGFSTAPSRYTL